MNDCCSAPAETGLIAIADCMAISGRMVRRGARAWLVSRVHVRAIEVRLENGTTEIVHPDCFTRSHDPQ